MIIIIFFIDRRFFFVDKSLSIIFCNFAAEFFCKGKEYINYINNKPIGRIKYALI